MQAFASKYLNRKNFPSCDPQRGAQVTNERHRRVLAEMALELQQSPISEVASNNYEGNQCSPRRCMRRADSKFSTTFFRDDLNAMPVSAIQCLHEMA